MVDILTKHGGKIHGSQRDRDPNIGLIDLYIMKFLWRIGKKLRESSTIW
jgi:hypothetical protein